MNPNTPVFVGISQIQQRHSNLKADQQIGDEPIDMMLNAVRAAAVDAGNEKILLDVDLVRVIRGIWRYKQPAGYIAERIGSPGAG